ncbi:MAG: SDR family NAD(P)-dependent oxidoreductase, partial [Steroidobacteraceae bacterium]
MTRTLAASGYRVIAVARKTSEELEAAAAAARDAHRGAIEFRACDLSDVAQIKPLVRAVRADFGPIYGLINNAGLGTAGLLGTMPDAEIERLIRLNTISPIVLTKYVA